MDKKLLKTKAIEFWEEYETKIILVVGFILVSVVSFEAGTLRVTNISQKPIVIEKTPIVKAIDSNSVSGTPSQPLESTSEAKIDQGSANILPQNCMFIGSKNSNKYHLPTCRYAKSINPENRVCFSSPDEAQSKGYLPDKNCIK